MVKREAQEQEAAQAGRASRARAATVEQTNTPAELSRVYGGVDLRQLHCAVVDCNRPLKPPVFKCEAGHRLCGGCRGDGHCRRCGRDTIFVHCGPDLDGFVSDFRVPCAYACGSVVVYHDAAAHREACAYAPCPCAVSGCAFAASPPMLRHHLASEHSWSVHMVPGYGMPVHLRVPASESTPAHAHRLLVVEGDERRLFVVSVRARGASDCAVTVACVRASGAAEAGPQYESVLVVQAPGVTASRKRTLMMEAEVPSYAVPGGGAEEMMELLVPFLMLCGPSKEIDIKICINVVHQAPASPLPAVC